MIDLCLDRKLTPENQAQMEALKQSMFDFEPTEVHKLAVILFQAITGLHPFEVNSSQARCKMEGVMMHRFLVS